MMPNMDPRAMKSMLERMGITSREIPAERVIIQGKDKEIIIENAQVVAIETKGAIVSFNISGDVSERDRVQEPIEISDDDIKLVREQTGIQDTQKIQEALIDANGNIAEAIIKLKKDQ